MSSCDCKENFVCSPISGCVCRYGFTGEYCNIRLVDRSVMYFEEEPKSNSGIVVGTCVAVLLVVVIVICIVFYYKRRVNHLKNELAYVTYTADPRPPPDRRHFDNPVYAFQAVHLDGTLNNASGAPNIKQIHNDLNCTKSNIEKAKLGYCDDDDQDSQSMKGACGGNDYESNCKDFDFKPNIYQSIEDLKSYVDKKEPFYDEVKDKGDISNVTVPICTDTRQLAGRSSSDADGYDHLEYNRPKTETKPNYFRLDSTLPKKKT